MARTAQAAALTADHRRAQLALRSLAIRDYLRLWPLWDGQPGGFERLIAATVPLVEAHHRTSSGLAAAYYEAFRRAEAPGGSPATRLASLDKAALTVSMYTTGRNMTRRALAAGMPPEAAMRAALVRTSGTVSRVVLSGSRDTLVETVRADRRARGYRRVLSGHACDFCQSLAGETTESDFEAHDHCACGAEPDFL